MTNNEFKAWFEGFNEGIDFAPTGSQWAKIVAKVKQIDNIPLFPQVVYRDRYVTGPYRDYGYYTGAAVLNQVTNSMSETLKASSPAGVYDQREELFNLGKQESQS